jgi:DNA-binding GntR family transcriptional regulator
VYDQLHQQLRTGALKPGTRLVNRTLAAELGTSTIPVREAISRLVSEGIAESTPGGGAFVRCPDANELSELYDVREALEVLAAGEAAKFATDHLIAELRTICVQFRHIAGAISQGKPATRSMFNRWLEAEEQFHTRLVAASRNRWLIKTIDKVRVIAQVFAIQRLTPRLLSYTVAHETLCHHEAFLEILASRDSERAKVWMSEHIRNGRNTVLAHYSANASSDKTTN